MSSVVLLSTRLLEGTTPVYSVQLVDQQDTPISKTSLVTLTLTYYDVVTKAVINDRRAQDIFDQHDVQVSAGGLVTWNLREGDTVILHTDRAAEGHVALFTWSWEDGMTTRIGRHEVQLMFEAVPLGT